MEFFAFLLFADLLSRPVKIKLAKGNSIEARVYNATILTTPWSFLRKREPWS
jgi:hypothetical protein